MEGDAKASTSSHPLDAELRPGPRTIYLSETMGSMNGGSSGSSMDAESVRILKPFLNQDQWKLLQTGVTSDELVQCLAHTVCQLLRLLLDTPEEAVVVSSSPETQDVSFSLREAMLDEWDLNSDQTIPLERKQTCSTEKQNASQAMPLQWLQRVANLQSSAVASSSESSSRSLLDSSSESVTSETESVGSIESNIPEAAVTELSHITPLRMRPPAFHPQPPKQDSEADRYGFVSSAESPPLISPDLYDIYQKERESEWDSYLAMEHAGPKTMWYDVFQYLRALDHNTSAGKKSWRVFQRLCHRGIPMSYRAAIWAGCVRASELIEPGWYKDFVANHRRHDQQIKLDVRRTLPSNRFFGGDGPGVAKLQRILEAQSAQNPAQGYCQGMNNLGAILLLTYTHEEDAFWTMTGILRHVLPEGFYATSMRVPQADQVVFLSLVRKGMPRLYGHFKRLNVELAAVTFSWFLSLFTVCLPPETIFRVWDMLMVDGNVVLFRVAYAILAHCAPKLFAASSAAAVYDTLRDTTAQWTEADALIQSSVQLRSFIRLQDVTERREQALWKIDQTLSRDI
ncbi:hypothetical protein MYAM1_002013 [Malassezia yamatoensis]|uniref:Rab-GAP TBC domain-containing protein n=1 Tax=Malassezia yamatoensis TaxID=253288 RepID=A0AAJ6CGX2_9BASI|nr:hypothetical protein MYAM1_002013 [Malassezia yamatoensis]